MRTIVLSVHGLGANWLGCYGNEWVATPNLDRLAAAGTVFDNHYAETLPGFDPFAIDVARIVDKHDGGPPLKGIRKNLKLPEDGLIVIESDAFAPPWFVPRELFDDYWDFDEKAKPIVDPSTNDNLRIVRASYAAAVTYFDAEFEALRSLLPEVVWIVTGTHGIPLGEHGTIGGANLHEESTHLPMIVSTGGGLRIADLTAPSDLPHIAMRIPRACVVSRLGTERAIRTTHWTLIDGLQPRLFQHPADHWEMNDVSRLHPDMIEELQRLG